jgi:signal peptidase I
MKSLVLITALALLLSACKGTGLTYTVATESMAPTLKVGDVIFADPIAYKIASPQRGDIVVVRAPDGETNPNGQIQMFPKRIIGVGGDKIRIVAGKLYVNDQPVVLGIVPETGKYFSDHPVGDFGPVTVPKEQYFLVGDNLPNSLDSRYWKHSTVTKDYFIGKVTTVKDKGTGNIRYL